MIHVARLSVASRSSPLCIARWSRVRWSSSSGDALNENESFVTTEKSSDANNHEDAESSSQSPRPSKSSCRESIDLNSHREIQDSTTAREYSKLVHASQARETTPHARLDTGTRPCF